MLWALLLAHFLGDFPLQPDWMVRRKTNFWILLSHVSIHFLLMLLLVGQSRTQYWPYLLLIALIHMGQDWLKIFLTNRWPVQRVFLFFSDQLLHLFFIYIVVARIENLYPNGLTTQRPTWVLIAIAYLAATYTWYICERVIHHTNADHLKIIEETKIARMLVRSGMVSLFFLLRTWAISGLAFIFISPYPASSYRKQAVMTDVGVSLVVIVFLFITIG
jgi:hypothetical protein